MEKKREKKRAPYCRNDALSATNYRYQVMKHRDFIHPEAAISKKNQEISDNQSSIRELKQEVLQEIMNKWGERKNDEWVKRRTGLHRKTAISEVRDNSEGLRKVRREEMLRKYVEDDFDLNKEFDVMGMGLYRIR